jgi:hypothetical protein
MILYENTYEREGNDSWLKDFVQLHLNDMGLYLEHKLRWNGWFGEMKENHTLELDENDLEKSQRMIDEYIYEHGLQDSITIKLNELIS